MFSVLAYSSRANSYLRLQYLYFPSVHIVLLCTYLFRTRVFQYLRFQRPPRNYKFKKSPTSELKWSDQLAEELNKPVTRKFPKRKVYVSGIDKIWAADLIDMQAFSKYNKGVKYLLTIIDAFSKYGWIVPLKQKTGIAVASALEKVFKERKPEKLWVYKVK